MDMIPIPYGVFDNKVEKMVKATQLLEDYVALLDGFLSADECRQFIRRSEALVFEEATITTQDGVVRNDDIRNNDRVLFDDFQLSTDMWERIEPHVPKVFKNRRVLGLNERWRFYRYGPKQQFDWHMDGAFERENGQRSLFTLLIYLNDDFEGGGTTFCDVNCPLIFEDFRVQPKAGSALLFFHPIMHRGDPVEVGQKYVMRTDVMFSPLYG